MNAEANDIGTGGYGPAMQALTEKQRRYVVALFSAPKSHGALTFAARRAGYGTPTSSRQSLSQMAHALNADPKVQAAIAEASQQYITVLGPHAVRALKKVLDNPGHRDFGRALGLVVDRVSPVQSTAIVKVEHEAVPSLQLTAKVFERIMQLAAQANVAPMIDVSPEKAA
jgi:D-arabinose 1-dehydrogenase-like Zn-dependent alcohol dehydrogenase